MKCSVAHLLALLVLAGLAAGCGKSQPAAPAAADESPAAPAAVAETPAPVELAVPVVAEEPALSEEQAAVVVAKVNGANVTEGDIEKVVRMFKKQMGSRIPDDQMQSALPRIRERVIEELIMRRVMLEAVAKDGISLSDSEFEEVKTELAAELPPGTTLESYMADTGTTEAEMREQMAVRKMVLAKADAIAKPTEEEIKAFYDENKDSFSQGESVTASHILIKLDPVDDEAAKTAKRERIEGLRKQLLEGADFAELAKANSDCPSSASGGDLGSFGRGQMVPEFEKAAFSQATGSVGDVVETQFGFHIIKVTEHSEAKTLGFDEVKARISDTLYSRKQQEAVSNFVESLRTAADIQRFDKKPDEAVLGQLDEEPALEEAAPAAEVEAPAAEEVAAPAVEVEAPAVEEIPVPAAEVEAPVAEEVPAPAVEAPAPEAAPVPAVEEAPVPEAPVAPAAEVPPTPDAAGDEKAE